MIIPDIWELGLDQHLCNGPRMLSIVSPKHSRTGLKDPGDSNGSRLPGHALMHNEVTDGSPLASVDCGSQISSQLQSLRAWAGGVGDWAGTTTTSTSQRQAAS